MDTKLFWIFVVLNITNVIIQTVKSICTIKCGKWTASIINAIAYGLYTWVIVMTNCELNLFVKCLVVAIANLIGVYVVKLIEEKSKKDKLWKVELTVNESYAESLNNELIIKSISHNYIAGIGNYTLFNCYCATQKESANAKEIAKKYNAKYFATETKIL